MIEREKVKDVASTQFIGSNRKNVFAYKISVRNKKAQEIRLRIDDQVPLPNTKEITVDKLEDSGAAVDDETGLLTWNLRVPPGKTQDLELRYMVKYPRYSALVLE